MLILLPSYKFPRPRSLLSSPVSKKEPNRDLVVKPRNGNLGVETFLLCQKVLEDLESVCADVEALRHWCKLSCLQIKVMLSATERTYCSHKLCVAEPGDGAGSMRGAGSLEVLNHREDIMALARM